MELKWGGQKEKWGPKKIFPALRAGNGPPTFNLLPTPLVGIHCCFHWYKCLQGQAPVYLTRLCVPTSSVFGRSRLRSADDNQLVVPRTITSTFGPRAFSTSGPAAWNALSSELRDPSISLDCFRHSLKTYLYKR